jgi:hypothetical protein
MLGSISPKKLEISSFQNFTYRQQSSCHWFYNDSIDLNKLKTRDVILKINNLDVEIELIKESRYQSGSNKTSNQKYLLQNIQRFRKYCNFDN